MSGLIEKWHELEQLIAESLALPAHSVDDLERLHRQHLQEQQECERHLLDGIALGIARVSKAIRVDDIELERQRQRRIQANARRQFRRDTAVESGVSVRWKQSESVIEDIPTEYPVEIVDQLPDANSVHILHGQISQISDTMVVRNYQSLGYKVGKRSSRRYEGFRMGRRFA